MGRFGVQSKPRICYIIPLWGGKRRYQHPEMDKDASFYAREHVKALKTYTHNLTHIIAAVPEHPEPVPSFDNYVFNEMGEEIKALNGPSFAIAKRPNVGLSYGAFSDIFAYYKTAFDYYLFQEDDVIYPQHNFDKLWLDLLNTGGPRCGFACGWLAGGSYDNTTASLHAGVSCGIFRSQALAEVEKRYGSLCTYTNAEYSESEMNGQIGMSQRLFSINWCAVDWRGTDYKLGFRRCWDGSIDWFGKTDGDKVILQPL